MALTAERLQEIATELARGPGHEKVRSLVYQLLVEGLGTESATINFEATVPEVRGRLDALVGNTIFEFKRDLRVEGEAAEAQLARYLGDRQRATGRSFVGIATDGNVFRAYELRRGKVTLIQDHQVNPSKPRDLLEWLDSATALRADLDPDPETVVDQLGRESIAFQIARRQLQELWEQVREKPDVEVKRQLWEQLLGHVYGSEVRDDELFFQHTYLTVVAKTMATLALGVDLPAPADLLSGRQFTERHIYGAVESDFFDWVLHADGSNQLIGRIARAVGRFRLARVQMDVLKGLYESLVDPAQRHDLGEYYTPDWLAERICNHVITDPLNQRILDPSCGSGTFLFHAARKVLAAADEAGLRVDDSLQRCTSLVYGVDIHPLAVIISRVTYLLALGERLATREESLSIPVYLGDSLQWDVRPFMSEVEVSIPVPEGPVLQIPGEVIRDPQGFDRILDQIQRSSLDGDSPEAFQTWLQRNFDYSETALRMLTEAYRNIAELHRLGRNHIWTYVARNLSRPAWLSAPGNRPHIVIGNPPWLSYRYMSSEMQARFRKESQRLGVWEGGKVATHQDLSGYFFARCCECYLEDGGAIAFVMPYAALTRQQFRGFRTGRFGPPGSATTVVAFSEPWAFDERVRPLLPVPACVVFATRTSGEPVPMPTRCLAAAGSLPARNVGLGTAEQAVRWSVEMLQHGDPAASSSPYRERFRQGATVVPRMLWLVEKVSDHGLGQNVAEPLVRSRRSTQEKAPWKTLQGIEGRVESRFLRPLYLGESIVPYRVLEPALAVIPWDDVQGQLLDADAAGRAGYLRLATWLRNAEDMWRQHGSADVSLSAQLNYYGKLTAQLPIPAVRVVYAKSGEQPAAAVLRDTEGIVDHKLYWAAAAEDEAYYLVAILNSETARAAVAGRQSRGQWGARDFDKVMLDLPIPKFDGTIWLHQALATAARQAEEVAASVDIPPGTHFVRARQRIREELQRQGVSQTIDTLVAQLLNLPAPD